jgi:hypothetical protein
MSFCIQFFGIYRFFFSSEYGAFSKAKEILQTTKSTGQRESR